MLNECHAVNKKFGVNAQTLAKTNKENSSQKAVDWKIIRNVMRGKGYYQRRSEK